MVGAIPIRWFQRGPGARPPEKAVLPFDPLAFSPPLQTQLLILQPTPFCNIDCDYCYLPHRQDRSRMSMATVRMAARRLVEDGLVGPQLTVVWHAGEPLALPPDYYEEAFGEIAAAIGPGCTVTHSFQTNATLISEDWCRLLLRHRARVGVSVDGPADLHDRHRRNRRGEGTHARVLAGMARLRAHGIAFHVIAVITRESLGRAQDLHDFFVAQCVAEVGMNFDEAEGAHTASSIEGREDLHAAFLEETLALSLQSGERYRVRELVNAFHLIAEPLPTRTYRAYAWPENAQTVPFALTSVGWNGDFSTFSPELLGQPNPDFDNFVLGNVNETTYLAATEKRVFQRLWQGVVDGCRTCEAQCAYFRYCGGGAPANKLYEHGRLNAGETLYCRAMVQRPFEVVLEAVERAATRGEGRCEASARKDVSVDFGGVI